MDPLGLGYISIVGPQSGSIQDSHLFQTFTDLVHRPEVPQNTDL